MSRASVEVQLAPGVLRWARERARLTPEALAKKVQTREERVAEWERTGRLRMSQAEKVAHATHTPAGFLFLPRPPEEALDIADFRTLPGAEPARPSPELLEVLDAARLRQDWYRDYLLASGEAPLDFPGSLEGGTPSKEAARRISERHGLGSDLRANAGTWDDALRLEIERIEASGVLVMRNGIAGNNTHRPLDVGEFRGFALSDPFAPLIFLNGRDARAAQVFTLMHELTHIWLGQSGVSNATLTATPDQAVERYCNAVAAEILVPEEELRALVSGPDVAVDALTRRFKVSALVVLGRLRDTGVIHAARFRALYADEEARIRERAEARPPGGDFYRTTRSRTSRRFATALIESTLEGRTPWRDAMRLLGVSKTATFNELARNLGFAV